MIHRHRNPESEMPLGMLLTSPDIRMEVYVTNLAHASGPSNPLSYVWLVWANTPTTHVFLISRGNEWWVIDDQAGCDALSWLLSQDANHAFPDVDVLGSSLLFRRAAAVE